MQTELTFLISLTAINTAFILIVLLMFIILNNRKNKVLSTYILGLSFQLAAISIFAIDTISVNNISKDLSIYLASSLLMTGFAIQILSITSFTELFLKRNVNFITAAIFIYWIWYAFIDYEKYLTMSFNDSLWIGFFFGYGGFVLITKRQKVSRFRRFLGSLFMAYAVFNIFRSGIVLFYTDFFTANDALLNIIMYIFGNFILIFASFGIILILKEQDEKVIEKDKILLQEANDSKVKLFSIISHDLKGPIGYIKPLVELLEKNCIQNKMDRAHDLIDTIKDTSDNAFNLLENILDWSKNQFEYFKINPVNFKINKVANEIIDLYSIRAKEKEVELLCKNKCEDVVFADPDVIKVVIRNLISNALKFTHSGGSIFLESIQEKNKVILKIKDTGVGIEKEKIPDIFKINTKKTTAGTAGEIGTGLGLTLSAELINKNKGTISLESEVNVGTTIKITLPSKVQ